MGCFDSTCAITRTSIHIGDEVLIVGINPTYRIRNTYELSQELGSYLRRVEKENWIEPVLRFAQLGTYNDYGSVKGLDNQQGIKGAIGGWWDYQFMCHREAVQKLLPQPFEHYESATHAIHKLADLCFLARINLMGHELLGAQYFDREELDLQRKVLQLTEEVINKKEEQLVEEALEWEEEDDDTLQ